MGGARGRIGTLGLISAVIAVPFFLLNDIPFFDLPIHIARAHILFDPALSDARAYYLVSWRLLPNMALDLTVFVLHFVMSIDMAVRLFLALTALQLFLGAVALNHVLFDEERRFYFLPALFVFNGPLLLGLVNLSFGLGMVLWIFALWIKYAGRRFGWALFAILGSAILIAHLFAFAVYAICVVTYSLARGYRRPEGAAAAASWTRDALSVIARDCVHLVLPIGLYFLVMPRDLRESTVVLSTIKYKLWALATIGGVYNLQFDVVLPLAAAYAAFALRRHLQTAAFMGLPLLALAVTFILLPYQIGQGTWVDYRIPAIFTLVLAASTGWQGSSGARRNTEITILAVFALRMVVMTAQWWSWQPVYAEYHAAFRLLPPGARLLPIGSHADTIIASEHPPLSHMDAIAVTERGAFIPTMLADRAYELLRYAPDVAPIKRDFDGKPRLGDYDYALIIHPDQNGIPEGVEEIAHGTDFVLARIAH